MKKLLKWFLVMLVVCAMLISTAALAFGERSVVPDGEGIFIHTGITFGMTMEAVKVCESSAPYKQDETSLMYEVRICDCSAYLTYTFGETGLNNISYYITPVYYGEYNRYIEDDRRINAKLTEVFGPSVGEFWSYKLNNNPGVSTLGVDEIIDTKPPFEADDLTYGAYYDMGRLSHTMTWSQPLGIYHALGNAGVSMHLLIFTPGQEN